MSLDRFTPFFWNENRVGNLTPLAMMWVRSPYLNLILQSLLYTSGPLLCIASMNRFCGAPGEGKLRAAMRLQFAVLFAYFAVRLNASPYQVLFLSDPMSLSVALYLIALNVAVVNRPLNWPRATAVAVSSFLGAWLYIGNVVFALAAVSVSFSPREWIRKWRGRPGVSAATIVSTALVEQIWSPFYRGPGLFAMQSLDGAYSTFVRMTHADFTLLFRGEAVVVLALIGIAGPLVRSRRFLSLCAASLATAVAMSLSPWPRSIFFIRAISPCPPDA